MSRAPKPTRILYLIDDLDIGGAQRALLSQAAALDPVRFEVHVASLERITGGSLEPAFRGACTGVHPLVRPGEPKGLAALRFRGLVGRLAPEVVHTHLAAAGIAGRVAARTAGVPQIVSTLHNVLDWAGRHAHPARILDRVTLAMAHTICAASDAVRTAFTRACPGLADRTLTLRSGVDLDRFRVTPERRDTARKRLGLAPADFVVASVARLEPRKDLRTLLRAAALAGRWVPTLQLLIVGDGPERHRLEDLAESLRIAGWVSFVGAREDVSRYLAAADVLAVPSRMEGLGFAALEALAAGLPVLASDVGGLHEIVEDGICGRLLPPGELDAWALALAEVATHPDGLESLKAAAVRRARAFSIQSSAEALERLYGSPPQGDTRRRQAA